MAKNDLKETTDIIQMNTYLEVDFTDKDKVKAAGAKWCALRKKMVCQRRQEITAINGLYHCRFMRSLRDEI